MINVAATAASVASQATGGLIHTSTLDANVQRNLTDYTAAQTGSQSALNDLVLRSGITGLSAGYAPQNTAREDARTKLQALLSGGFISGPNPVPPQATAPTGVKYEVVNKVTGPVGGDKPSLSVTSAAQSTPAWQLLVVAGLLGWGAYQLFKRKG